MADVELASVREELAVPIAAAWAVLADWPHPERLAPTIERTEVNGAVRIVHSSRGLTIHEELLELHEDWHRLRYRILDRGDMPFAHVTSYCCTVEMQALGEAHTAIHWRSEGTVDGPIEPIRDFLTVLYRTASARIAEQAGGAMAIDRLLAEAVETGVAAGFVGIVADANGEVYAGAAGSAKRDTIFWIASMTKLVTTVAAMQLVEAGQLALDEPVAAILPELADRQVLDGFDDEGRSLLRPMRGAITLRHLLTHRSGIGYEIMNPRLMRARGAAAPPPHTSLASLDGPLLFDPGEGWEYGFGIDWAGLAVERRTGMTLDRYFAERIFAPLGMIDTSFGRDGIEPGRSAAAHLRQPDGSLKPIPSPAGKPEHWEFFSGGAGLSGTAGDYVRFLRMLLNGGVLDGARVLAAETVEAMWLDQAGEHAAGCVGTAVPSLFLPYDPLPGERGGWSLLGSRNPRDLPGRRRAGSASWVGAGGTVFWIDRASDLCGVLLAQLLPFGDPQLTAVRERFETAAYPLARP